MGVNSTSKSGTHGEKAGESMVTSAWVRQAPPKTEMLASSVGRAPTRISMDLRAQLRAHLHLRRRTTLTIITMEMERNTGPWASTARWAGWALLSRRAWVAAWAGRPGWARRV